MDKEQKGTTVLRAQDVEKQTGHQEDKMSEWKAISILYNHRKDFISLIFFTVLLLPASNPLSYWLLGIWEVTH